MTDAAPPAAPFLPPRLAPGRRAAAEDRPFPVRGGNSVTPLVLAEDMYPALERAVLGARETAYLAFRIFDPETRARSDEARALGLADWTAILDHVVRRGVTVRLLLADFEPTVAHHLHGLSWRAFRVLEAMAARLDPQTRDRFEIIISQHPGEVGWGWRQLLRLPVGLAVRRVLARLDVAALDALPGLWRWHRVDGEKVRFRGSAARLWPATHHHKFAVIDGTTVIVGGIDVNERRWETHRYASRADRTWHDVSVAVTGPAAADAAAHFARLWNTALPRYRALTRWWLTDAERELVVDPIDPIHDTAPSPPAATGEATVQMLRTLSRRSRSPFAFGPSAHVRELMHGYRQAILSARRLLYIEAQFFRSPRAAGWVLEAARRSPALQVIVVLPQAPDDVAFEGQTDNPAHRHGEWLQARALGRLKRRLGDRIGLFGLAKREPLSDAERKFVATRGALFGSGMIYVHSKLLIADDDVALVSSANINNRSFLWDSEFGLMWQDGEGVATLRRRLWCQLLGLDEPSLPQPDRALAWWRDTAAANILKPPPDRQGFIVPYTLARARRFGRPSWFVPDDLV